MPTFAKPEEYFQFLESLQFTANDQVVPTGQRPCPICKKNMRPAKVHDLTIDVCVNHGIWLDSGELSTLVARSKPTK